MPDHGAIGQQEFTRFRVGRGVGLISPNTIALLEPSNGELSEMLWELIERDADIDDLLEALSATGLRSLGAFALAQFESNLVRVVVRGTAIAELGLNNAAPIIVNAVDVRTWVEEVIPDASTLMLGLRHFPENALPFRLNSGIVPADLLARGNVAGSGLRDLYLTWAADEVSGVASSARPSLSLPPPHIGTRVDPPRSVDDRTADPPEFERAVASPTVADAPIIQGVPLPGGAPVGAGTPATASLAGPVLGDHDGHTISRAELDAMRANSQIGVTGAPGTAPDPRLQPSMGGPNVQSVVCAAGHANPPHLGSCRQCGTVLDANPVLIARPPLGSIHFSDGRIVRLDKPVVVGRNPRLEGRMPSEIPTLVKLDVGSGLSRTHAIIRLDGWQVLLEDLDSANGTMLTLPGRPVQRLHAREPAILEHRAMIDFGGEVTATFFAE